MRSARSAWRASSAGMRDAAVTRSMGTSCTDNAETTRANSDAAFDLMSELMSAKSYSEVVELSSAYLRKQFDALIAQTRELTEHAQKVATETAEPIKESISNNFNKAA